MNLNLIFAYICTMKKTITIGDIHGRSCWKEAGDISELISGLSLVPKYDHYIFLGDYVDSFTLTNEEIKENLLEIINFKKMFPNNVVLLWGNHDIEYWVNKPWCDIKNFITGYRAESHFDLYDIFEENKNIIQMAFQIDNYLWTHAGVHKGWYNYVFKSEIKGLRLDNLTISGQLNSSFLYGLKSIHDCSFYRGGSKKVGGPLWLDKSELVKKPLDDYHQIVGHSHVDKIETFDKNNSSITLCDVLNNEVSFYELNID